MYMFEGALARRKEIVYLFLSDSNLYTADKKHSFTLFTAIIQKYKSTARNDIKNKLYNLVCIPAS